MRRIQHNRQRGFNPRHSGWGLTERALFFFVGMGGVVGCNAIDNALMQPSPQAITVRVCTEGRSDLGIRTEAVIDLGTV